MNDALSPEKQPIARKARPITQDGLDAAIENSRNYLLSRQAQEGYWVDELESNATITAELIFFMHFTGQVDLEKQEKMARYLLGIQREDGSWPLYYGGPCDINSTVECYMALKIAGRSLDAPEMARAREAILKNGGIRATRVFTKIFLAMLGQISWKHVPAVPVEIILLPDNFPFNIYEISSWSRGTVVPLSIVYAHRPVHRLPKEKGVAELFTEQDRALGFKADGHAFSSWHNFFIHLDGWIKVVGRCPWKPLRKKALVKAEQWVLDHQEDEGDFAGIQPAMLNSLLALHYQGYDKDHPAFVRGMEAVERFLIDRGDHMCMQACVSPLWDTAITLNALMDSGLPGNHPALVKAGEWILGKQVVKRGDWQVKRPHAEPGGWAFEFYNELYPDTDDTAEILIALNRIAIPDTAWKEKETGRALAWLLHMQSNNGGWAAFDVENDKEILNEIPFADHKALLDPPTTDVSSRILWALGNLGFSREHPKVRKAIDFVKRNQETDGCWWGRWGVNYIYGTFLALNGLRSIGENMDDEFSQKAARWLMDHQNEDGGWGETCESYSNPALRGQGASTASQTAWAILGLVAAGKAGEESTARGVSHLIDRQNESDTWWEPEFTGTGFPEHFYIKYHMYQHFFPLMALSRYRSARQSQSS
ncbi:MAG: squalene--hopene cyclase [Nitrospinaceae bacterium]|nr:MAG: squalene--hopene cyclase [Nitrospinaceae bacterium]